MVITSSLSESMVDQVLRYYQIECSISIICFTGFMLYVFIREMNG